METSEKQDQLCLPESYLPRIVVIGGGFGGISLIRKLKNQRVQVVLLDKNNFHQFQPLLYQVAISGIESESIAFPLRKMFKGYKNFVFRMAKVESIDHKKNLVNTDIGAIKYDYLVIATGSKTNFHGLNDKEPNCLGLKNIREALDIRSLVLERLETAVNTCDLKEKKALATFTIAGGGATGVELAGALAEFKKYILPKDYPELNPELMTVHLMEGKDRLLSSMSEKSSAKALKYLQNIDVKVKLNTLVKSYDGTCIIYDKEAPLDTKTVIWTAGVVGSVPKGISEEHLVRGNRIKIDDHCKVIGYDNIYAVGDIAAIVSEEYPNGHPMVAQAAIQQGKYLSKKFKADLRNKEIMPFRYKDKGSLAQVGKRRAVADLGKFRFGGFIAWLLWSVVHLFSISGFRNKLLVGIDWVWNYFTYDKGNRLIIRKFRRESKIVSTFTATEDRTPETSNHL